MVGQGKQAKRCNGKDGTIGIGRGDCMPCPLSCNGTSGALHKDARQFLQRHTTALNAVETDAHPYEERQMSQQQIRRA